VTKSPKRLSCYSTSCSGATQKTYGFTNQRGSYLEAARSVISVDCSTKTLRPALRIYLQYLSLEQSDGVPATALFLAHFLNPHFIDLLGSTDSKTVHGCFQVLTKVVESPQGDLLFNEKGLYPAFSRILTLGDPRLLTPFIEFADAVVQFSERGTKLMLEMGIFALTWEATVASEEVTVIYPFLALLTSAKSVQDFPLQQLASDPFTLLTLVYQLLKDSNPLVIVDGITFLEEIIRSPDLGGPENAAKQLDLTGGKRLLEDLCHHFDPETQVAAEKVLAELYWGNQMD